MTAKLLVQEEPATYKVLVKPAVPVVRLGQLLTVIRGVTYKKEAASSAPAEGLVALLRATNIQQSLSFDELVYVPANCVSETQLLRAGDVLIVASSGSRSVVGKAAPLTRSWKGSFGAFCFALRPNAGVDPRYVAAFLRSPQYRDRALDLAAGTNINNLRATHIEETPIPLPTLDRQREVVAYLDEQLSRLDASVAALHRVQANLKRYRASVLKSACEGRLVPTEAELARQEGRDFETGAQLLQRILVERRMQHANGGKFREPTCLEATPPEAPAGWSWCSLDQIAVEMRNGFGGKPEGDSGTRILRISAVRALTLDMNDIRHLPGQSDLYASDLLRTDDLLFTRYNGSREFVGVCAVVPSLTEPTAHPDKLIKVRCAASLALPSFVALMASCGVSRAFLESRMRTTAGQSGISENDLRCLPIPLPPLAEQHRIVAEADRRLSLIRVAEAQVTANVTGKPPAPFP